VDRAGDEFLSRSGFAHDQNVGVCRGNLRDKIERSPQRGRSSDDAVANRITIDAVAQTILVLECCFNLIGILG